MHGTTRKLLEINVQQGGESLILAIQNERASSFIQNRVATHVRDSSLMTTSIDPSLAQKRTTRAPNILRQPKGKQVVCT